VNERSFFAFGNLTIDDLVFADGTTQWCTPGGNCMYAALGMALWGVHPSIVARYGNDFPVNALGENRVDLSLATKGERTLRNWGLYEEDGSRHFIFRQATRNWLEFSPSISDLGSGSYPYCHLGPLPWHLQSDFVAFLRQNGARLISVDVDDRRIAEVDQQALTLMLRQIDFFLPSRQDVTTLYPGISDVDALRRLRDLDSGIKVIAVKRGADGVIIHSAGDSDYMSLPAIASEVVDATGAGDSFCGGFLVGYAETGSALEGALRGSVSASFCVAGLGPSTLVDPDTSEAHSRVAALRGRAEIYPL
jgi:sugar/nucleoside kinase (ribokinase family)